MPLAYGEPEEEEEAEEGEKEGPGNAPALAWGVTPDESGDDLVNQSDTESRRTRCHVPCSPRGEVSLSNSSLSTMDDRRFVRRPGDRSPPPPPPPLPPTAFPGPTSTTRPSWRGGGGTPEALAATRRRIARSMSCCRGLLGPPSTVLSNTAPSPSSTRLVPLVTLVPLVVPLVVVVVVPPVGGEEDASVDEDPGDGCRGLELAGLRRKAPVGSSPSSAIVFKMFRISLAASPPPSSPPFPPRTPLP